MSKFKLAFIALCVATIVLGTVFYYTRLEYARVRLAKPYWGWRRGFYVMVTGEFLILAWVVFFGKLLTRKVFPRLKGLKDKKKITASRANVK